MLNNDNLTFVRFCKFCLVEAVPEIIVMVILGWLIEVVGTVSGLLAGVIFVLGLMVVCYWTLKWIEYTCGNDKIQNWIEK